jgi:hypothetical protein
LLAQGLITPEEQKPEWLRGITGGSNFSFGLD